MRVFRMLSLTFLAAAVITGLGCKNPAEDKTEAIVDEPVTTTASRADGEILTVGEGSTINFTGSKVTGSHNGGFKSFTSEINLVDNDPTASSVTIEIDTASLYSDNERLTGHLMSEDFFDVGSHPTATFDSTSIVADGDAYMVTGNLDLHGVRKSISFPAEITVDEGSVTATADFFIKRFDFNIEYKGKADDLIRDEVVIQFNLTAQR